MRAKSKTDRMFLIVSVHTLCFKPFKTMELLLALAPSIKKNPQLFLYRFRIYARTIFLYQFRIYANSTCVHALLAKWRYFITCMVEMGAMLSCIFNLCDVRMRIAITCIVHRGYPRGSSLKKSVSGGSFIKVKSVKEELKSLDKGMAHSFYCILFLAFGAILSQFIVSDIKQKDYSLTFNAAVQQILSENMLTHHLNSPQLFLASGSIKINQADSQQEKYFSIW